MQSYALFAGLDGLLTDEGVGVARFIARRVLYMLVTLVLVSFVAFMIIQLPPGNFLTSYISKLQSSGQSVDQSQIAALRSRYGLNQPLIVQYLKWVGGMVHGDFGQSFDAQQPVTSVIGERLPLTMVLGVATLALSWAIALPAGIYAAVRRNKSADYAISSLSFLGMSVPGFLVTMVCVWIAFRYLGASLGGFFSPQFANAPWNLGKILNLLSHLWLPALLVAVESIAGTIRIVRANLLDELRKPYVVTARSKGLSEAQLILKYPVRIALNPIFSTIGWVLPSLVNGEVIVAQVLGLPTTGPLLISALQDQDMYLAGGLILMLCGLTVVGTLISDLVLAIADPRVRVQLIAGSH